MNLKGKYKLSYTLDRELMNLVLDIELRQTEGGLKPRQNLWYGVASLDKMPYTEEDLSCCVDANSAAKRIGRNIMKNIKSEAKKNGQVFRIKNEEII